MLSVLLLILPHLLQSRAQNVSSKRGLVYVASEYPSDDSIWDADNSDLTWYYNYSPYPTDGLDHSKLEFVPMLWGTDGADGFHSTIEGLIDGGLDVKHVLGFNEPDGCVGGGSCTDAKKAAQLWKDEIEPLKKLGVSLGAPAVTGSPRGMAWLEDFQKECEGGCTIDFLPVHWYGNFEGMAGYIGGISAAYQNLSTWVTEFGEFDVRLEEAQLFFHQSIGFLDDLP